MVDVALARLTPHRQQALQLLVPLVIQVVKGAVLQPPLQLPDTEAVGQRRVDFEGFLRDTPPPLDGERLQRADVVETVAQLDQHHSDVLRHGQEHLAEVFGLLFLQRFPGNPCQLGHTVNEERDLFAESGLDLAERERRVLGNVMEETGGDGRAVQAQLRQLQRNGERMLDKRLTRPPELAIVRGRGQVVGPAHDRRVCLRKVVTQLPQQIIQPQSAIRSWCLGRPIQVVLDLDRFLNVDCHPTASAPTLASSTLR